MEAHPLALFAADLTERYGAPQVLDVDYSVQIHRPMLSGNRSPSSYYIRPPEGLTAAELIALFEGVPGFQQMRLTLTAILGIDTYHQPLISVDDFAKKHFADNQFRFVRVVGGSNPAMEAMAALIEELKRPFSAAEFPHHSEFMVSAYRASAPKVPGYVKLLYKPADPTQLMKIEREVNLHLSEINLVRDIAASRHYTREQPPELILTAVSETREAGDYLEAVAASLPRATPEDVTAAVFSSERTPAAQADDVPKIRAQFGMNQASQMKLSHDELLKRVIGCLASILKQSNFGGADGLKIVMGGTGIDVAFPRSARALWLASSFDEKKDINTVKGACVGVRSDPLIRDGWDLHYRFDPKAGKLQLRAVDQGTTPANGAKAVPELV